MNLTPLKVRGKGPRKVGYKQPDPKRQKLSGSMASVTKKVPADPIEVFPKEILETIMLFAKEPDFLYASPHAYRLLRGDRSFLARMVLQAFEETWDLWLGLQRAQVHSDTGWYQDAARFGGDPEFQVSQVQPVRMSVEMLAQTSL